MSFRVCQLPNFCRGPVLPSLPLPSPTLLHSYCAAVSVLKKVGVFSLSSIFFALLSDEIKGKTVYLPLPFAEIAQLVEHQLPKLRVAGPSPVFRSNSQTKRDVY